TRAREEMHMKFGVRELVLVCAMVGLLAAAYFFVFSKAHVKRAELQKEIESKRTALKNLTQATAGVDDLGRKIDELQKAITFFESKLPQEREIDKILKEVSQMADANSLQTKTVKMLKSERG